MQPLADADAGLERVRATFQIELEERAQALNRLLLQLQGDEHSGEASTETWRALGRNVHGLRGAARAAELGPVEELAQRLEATFEAAREGARQPDAAWLGAVFAALDLLSPLAQYHLGAEQSPRPDPSEVLAALSRCTLGPNVASPAALPGPIDAGAVAPPERPTRAGRTESVRVAVDKLDGLLAQAGELTVTDLRIDQRLAELYELRRELDAWRREWRGSRPLRAALRHPSGQAKRPDLLHELEALLRFADRAERRTQAVLLKIDEIAARLSRDKSQLALVTQAIAAEVMAIRLVPIATLFGAFERSVRDLTRDAGKQARLVLEGGETEIDRKILEQLRDPLMHMLRNAVDHGLERPSERLARGKPGPGTIRIAAAQRGGTIELLLEDDGAGLDRARLLQAAVRQGLLTDEQAAALDEPAAAELIIQPGLTTSSTLSETSGRGVGMDVVREHVERLNGRIDVASERGRGVRFTIGVPLTVATTRAILVEQGGQLFALPSAAVERSARIREDRIVSLQGRRAVELDGHPVPVVELADVLERSGESRAGERARRWRPFVMLRHGDRRLALLTDGLVGEQEIVVKSLGWPLRRVRNVGGAAVLGSGQTVVILNPSDLLKSGLRLIAAGAAPSPRPASASPSGPRRPRLLVVDDSLMTRTLERSILEAAGYETVVAADGAEALGVLRDQSIDLVVSGVDMPHLDGFGLTTEIRRDEKLRHIPLVLVTSLDGVDHRERGVAAGADGYIVKGEFDQGELLETAGRLL